MRDITLEDTFIHGFTTRAFATGIPTVLAGTPALSVLEGGNATPITSGVSISVDRASVVGLNEATIVATAANGYEAGKSYSIYISTGTVGGVSVVGEKVGEFTVGLSAAAIDLANATDGLGALKALLPTSLSSGRMIADVEAINGSTAAAIRLALSAGQMIPGTVDTTAFSATTTEFEADDITTAAADHFNGRIVLFTTGALIAQVASIEDYALTGGRGHFTISAVTSIPANDVTFIIL